MQINKIIKAMNDFYTSSREVILPIILFILVLAIFGRMALNDFVYDDMLFRSNQNFQRIISPFYYFSHPGVWLSPFSKVENDIYRPLGFWFLAIQYRLFDFDPFYFHIISLFLHAFNAVLFFLLLKKILKSESLSFAGALIFAIHPITTETVAWIWQQPGLWGWFFSLMVLNLLTVEESDDNLFFTKKWRKIALLAILSFAAIFSKDHAVVLPPLYILCLLLLYAREKNLKKKIGEIAAVILPAILFLILRIILLSSPDRLELWGNDRFVVFLTMLTALVFYFRLLIWPYPLSVEYNQTIPFQKNFINSEVIFSFAFLLFLIISSILLWRKRPYISAGIIWIFIVLLPVSNFIIARDTIMNERFLYFVLPGFILAVLGVVVFIKDSVAKLIFGSKILARGAIFFLACIFLVFSYLTFCRLADWKNELALWRHEVEINPGTWRAELNYGWALEQNNKTDEAIKHYEKSLQASRFLSSKNFASSVRNLSYAYIKIGKSERAETLLLSALRQIPEDKELIMAAGQAYLAGKKYKEASEIFKKLWDEDSKDNVSAFYFILAEKLNGEKDEKIKIEIEKINNPAFRQLVFALVKGREKMLKGEYQEAIFWIYQGLTVNLPLIPSYVWLAECFEKIGDQEKALENYQIAAALIPWSVDAFQGIIRNGGEI